LLKAKRLKMFYGRFCGGRNEEFLRDIFKCQEEEMEEMNARIKGPTK
jgi:hypothetical protein